jgi:hypothetical protein
MAIEVMESRSFLDVLVKEFKIVEKYGIKENIRTRSRGNYSGWYGADLR